MLEFTRSNDTALVEKALLINDEMMVIDTDRKKRIFEFVSKGTNPILFRQI